MTSGETRKEKGTALKTGHYESRKLRGVSGAKQRMEALVSLGIRVGFCGAGCRGSGILGFQSDDGGDNHGTVGGCCAMFVGREGALILAIFLVVISFNDIANDRTGGDLGESDRRSVH